MSSGLVASVWLNHGLEMKHKFILLALADNADGKGRVEISLRDMAALCNVSKTTAEKLIGDLVESGFLRVASSSGKGSGARKYTINSLPLGALRPAGIAPTEKVDSEHVERVDITTSKEPAQTIETPPNHADGAAKPEAFAEGTSGGGHVSPAPAPSPAPTAISVSAVLDAAGVTPPADQPFYWSRREHRDQLAEILSRRRQSCDDLCVDLRAARQGGAGYENQPRTMEHVVAISGRGRGA